MRRPALLTRRSGAPAPFYRSLVDQCYGLMCSLGINGMINRLGRLLSQEKINLIYQPFNLPSRRGSTCSPSPSSTCHLDEDQPALLALQPAISKKINLLSQPFFNLPSRRRSTCSLRPSSTCHLEKDQPALLALLQPAISKKINLLSQPFFNLPSRRGSTCSPSWGETYTLLLRVEDQPALLAGSQIDQPGYSMRINFNLFGQTEINLLQEPGLNLRSNLLSQMKTNLLAKLGILFSQARIN